MHVYDVIASVARTVAASDVVTDHSGLITSIIENVVNAERDMKLERVKMDAERAKHELCERFVNPRTPHYDYPPVSPHYDGIVSAADAEPVKRKRDGKATYLP